MISQATAKLYLGDKLYVRNKQKIEQQLEVTRHVQKPLGGDIFHIFVIPLCLFFSLMRQSSDQKGRCVVHFFFFLVNKLSSSLKNLTAATMRLFNLGFVAWPFFPFCDKQSQED